MKGTSSLSAGGGHQGSTTDCSERRASEEREGEDGEMDPVLEEDLCLLWDASMNNVRWAEPNLNF